MSGEVISLILRMKARKLVRRIHALLFHEWRNESAAEIVAYANAGVGLAVSAALVWGFGISIAWATGAWLGAFVFLMACVRHRYLAWLAGLLGSGVVMACFAAAGWFLAHASLWPHAPSAGALAGALAGGGIAVPAYVRLLRDAKTERPSLVPASK